MGASPATMLAIDVRAGSRRALAPGARDAAATAWRSAAPKMRASFPRCVVPDVIVLSAPTAASRAWTRARRVARCDGHGAAAVPVVVIVSAGALEDGLRAAIEGAVRCLAEPVDASGARRDARRGARSRGAAAVRTTTAIAPARARSVGAHRGARRGSRRRRAPATRAPDPIGARSGAVVGSPIRSTPPAGAWCCSRRSNARSSGSWKPKVESPRPALRLADEPRQRLRGLAPDRAPTRHAQHRRAPPGSRQRRALALGAVVNLRRALEPWLDQLVGLDDLAPGARVVVGCSGGPDSLALLALARARDLDVVAVYVDHGLRVRNRTRRAASYARPPISSAPTPRVIEVAFDSRANLEARARDARYAALEPGRPTRRRRGAARRAHP